MNILTQLRPLIQQLGSGYATSVRLDQVAAELGLPVTDLIKLDSGENQFGPSVILDWSHLSRELPFYPDAKAGELKQLIAADVGIKPEMIAVGNGSDELIDLICRLFLEPGRTLVDFTPTFPMFSIFAQLTGATVVKVPRVKDFTLDVSAAVSAVAKADLTFLANPNNPTGTLIEPTVIRHLLATGRPVVVDEAYFEFCNQTVLPLLTEFENLIVLRTFSKWAGLAAVRVGYMMADPRLITKINTIKPPYNVNLLAQETAKAVLKNKQPFLDSVQRLVQGRDWFVQTLSQRKAWQVIPSHASCIVVIPRFDSPEKVAASLRRQGILVKVLHVDDLEPALRLSAAPLEVMAKVMTCLEEIEVKK